jgi:hypothetical protein
MQWIDFGDGAPVRAFVCTSPNFWNYPTKDRAGRLEQIEKPHLDELIALWEAALQITGQTPWGGRVTTNGQRRRIVTCSGRWSREGGGRVRPNDQRRRDPHFAGLGCFGRPSIGAACSLHDAIIYGIRRVTVRHTEVAIIGGGRSQYRGGAAARRTGLDDRRGSSSQNLRSQTLRSTRH